MAMDSEAGGAGDLPALAARRAADRPARLMGGPEALKFLRRDPVLKRVIRRIGPCTLRPVKREPYEALVRAIAHQQVHGRAACGKRRQVAGAAGLDIHGHQTSDGVTGTPDAARSW